MPLIIENGLSAGLVNGKAEIAYDPLSDFRWEIEGIALEGYRTDRGVPLRMDDPWVWLKGDDPLYAMIAHRLETEWANFVQRDLDKQLELVP